MNAMIRTGPFLLLVLLLAACGPARRAAPAADDGPTPVRVENNSWLDVRVFVVAGGQRQRLGVVPGNSSQTLDIPPHVVGFGREVSFIIDPIGSRTAVPSHTIFVRPGETVTLTVPPTVR